jgi:chromate reductase, NAD(P)H dehydrogenase (quinone)
MKITIIASSNNKNLELANTLKQIATQMGQTTQLINLVELGLPLYTPTEEKENGIPPQLKALVDIFTDTQAMIFVAPEYNGGIPPVLTNAIAWLSVSGDHWRGCFNGKSAMIATHSGSGGNNLLFALRNQLAYIGMNVVGRQIITNYNKKLNPESAQEVINQLILITS